MNKVLFMAVMLWLAGCTKPGNPPTTPGNNNPSNPNNPNNPTTAQAHFIPNWYSGDTLYGTILDNMNQWTGDYDTIFTLTIKDTSFIIYKSKRYYIWKEPLLATDTFVNNESTYVNCVVSPTTNIADAISESALNGAMPHKYIDAQGNWSYTIQSIVLNDWKKFAKVNGGVYMSRYQKK